jgi:hypothetical protein
MANGRDNNQLKSAMEVHTDRQALQRGQFYCSFLIKHGNKQTKKSVTHENVRITQNF